MFNIIDHPFQNAVYSGTISQSTFYDPEVGEEVTYKHFDPRDIGCAINYAYSCLGVFFNISDAAKELAIPCILFNTEQNITNRLQIINQKIPEHITWRGYNQADAIGFLLKSWINRYITCIEVCFVLTNEVLDLNLKGLALRPQKVIDKTDKKSKHYHSLCGLQKLQEQALDKQSRLSIRMANNQIKHHGKLYHEGLSNIETFHLFHEVFQLDNDNEPINPSVEIKMIHRYMIKKNNEVYKYIALVLDELTGLFEERFEFLKTKGS